MQLLMPMKLLLVLFLLIAASSGEGEYKNPFRSPSGAMNIDLTPMIDQVQRPAIPGCADVKYLPSEVMQDSMMWPWSGLKKFTRIVHDEYLKQSDMNERTLRYKANTENAKSVKRRLDATPGVSEVTKIVAECVARRMALNELPMSGAVCSCLSFQKSEPYCQVLDSFALNVHCHDSMADQVDKTAICPTLLSESLGVKMSQTCSGYVAGKISVLDLNLYTLNFPDLTPDQIDVKTAAQESKVYHVALKAIEKLTKWADAHLFCSEGNKDHKNLKDIELLPTWKSKLYFWIVEPSGRKLPLAVVAQREVDGTSSIDNTMIVIRNVRTTFEGRLFLTHQQSRKFVLTDIGSVHEGYDAVASMMLSPLVQFLKKFFAKVVSAHPKITTIGHGNFGAGIGAIVARDLSSQFKLAPSGVAIEHNLIAFGGGPVGNYDFNNALKENINVRNIVPDNAGFSDLPCETMRACGYENQVATGTSGQRFGPFFALPGRVTVDTSHLADDVWRTKMTQLETVANMNCATSCWLATKYCTDDPAPRCSYNSCGAFLSDEAKRLNAI